MGQHIAAAYIELVLQTDRDRLRREGVDRIAVGSKDARDSGVPARGKRHYLIAYADHARGDRAAVTTEVGVRAQDVLHREAEVDQVAIAGDVDRLQVGEQRRPLVPGHACAAVNDVVSVQRADRDEGHITDAQFGGEMHVLVADPLEDLAGVIHQVHLVDRDHEVRNPE